MNRILIIAGSILFVLGAVLLTPLADWLPIDPWFTPGDTEQVGDYMMVVPGGERPTWLFVSFMVIGFIMVLVSRLPARS